LKKKGITAGIDFIAENTNTAINHSKLITAVLSQTLDILPAIEYLILSYSSYIAPDSIPLQWIRGLVMKEYPDTGIDEDMGKGYSFLGALIMRIFIFAGVALIEKFHYTETAKKNWERHHFLGRWCQYPAGTEFQESEGGPGPRQKEH